MGTNCKVTDCKNKLLAKGYCSTHYKQIRKHGKILSKEDKAAINRNAQLKVNQKYPHWLHTPETRFKASLGRIKPKLECVVKGCNQLAKSKQLCPTHYMYHRKHGGKSPKFAKNIYDNEVKNCIVPECNKKHFALHLCHMHYRRWKKHGDFFLVKQKSGGREVGYNVTDKTKQDLHIKSQGIPRMSKGFKTSQYVGVSYQPKQAFKSWSATLGFNGKHIYLGSFVDELSAASAYDKKALELYGENAKTNLIHK